MHGAIVFSIGFPICAFALALLFGPSRSGALARIGIAFWVMLAVCIFEANGWLIYVIIHFINKYW